MDIWYNLLADYSRQLPAYLYKQALEYLDMDQPHRAMEIILDYLIFDC